MEENTAKSEVWEWVKSIIIAVVLAFIIKAFFLDFVVVQGSSMYPTLENGDRLVVSKISYTLGEPDYGDIVTLHYSDSIEYVKRIIGMGGDTIRIENNVCYRNGQPLDEPYINLQNYPNFQEVTVPEGCYFVMGDNRANSSDSRFQSLGFVDREDLVGKVVLRFWPFDQFGVPDNG